MTESPKKRKTERAMVYVRVRPKNEDELKSTWKESVVENIDTKRNVIQIKRESERKQFNYDCVFDQFSSQKEIYETIGKPVVDSVLEGYNGTILAYGQTGTGKTHTMIGGDTNELKGIIPRCMKQIFSTVNTSETHSYIVRVGFVQLYMEVLHDLIKPDPNNPVRIREDTEEGINLSGLSWKDVHSVSDCMSLLSLGDKNRNVAPTGMNSNSSRSHAVFMIKIEKRNKRRAEDIEEKHKDQSMTKSTLYLVDLAGSERVSKTKVSGLRLDEAKNINLALLALGNCIQALTENRVKYIPFRDSKLTRILEESLGGNSKTSLVVTIGPSVQNYQETVASLLFASRAMKMQNIPELNIKIDYKALCSQLQAELDRINDQGNMKNIDISKLIEENCMLKENVDKLSSEKIQLETMLEELKKGSDLSVLEGNTEEFHKLRRYYREKYDKQELEHKKFIQEIDKMLLDQEEQLNAVRNKNIELENCNIQLSSDLKKYQIELEKERMDRENGAAEMINEIEDLKQKLQLEKTNVELMSKEIDSLKGKKMKKTNSANLLKPISIKDKSGSVQTDKMQQLEIQVANLEEEIENYERRLKEEVQMHNETKMKYENETIEHKGLQKKYEHDVKKLKKQQVKLIKAFKNLEKKAEEEARSHLSSEKMSERSSKTAKN